MLKYIKWGNLYQNLRIEGQLKFKKQHYSNYTMGYRLPQYRRGLKQAIQPLRSYLRYRLPQYRRGLQQLDLSYNRYLCDIDHPNIEK